VDFLFPFVSPEAGASEQWSSPGVVQADGQHDAIATIVYDGGFVVV
jgi:hypothetical protein